MIIVCLILALILIEAIVVMTKVLKFDEDNKVELYAEKEDKAVDISYSKLTMAKAIELKKEYESEGYIVTIVLKKRIRKEKS